MSRARTITAHCKTDAPVIDAFQCSQCDWTFAMPCAESFVIAAEDAERACREFDKHACQDFRQRKPNGSVQHSPAATAGPRSNPD